MSQTQLIRVLQDELLGYIGGSPDSRLYPIFDDERKTYAVNGVENAAVSKRGWVLLQAHIDDDFIIIDHDPIWGSEKQLVTSLVAAGVPREQIILADAGETTPQTAKESE